MGLIIDDYECIGENIGVGAYSEVKLAKDKGGNLVVLKHFKYIKNKSWEQL